MMRPVIIATLLPVLAMIGLACTQARSNPAPTSTPSIEATITVGLRATEAILAPIPALTPIATTAVEPTPTSTRIPTATALPIIYSPINILEFGAPAEGELIRFYFILEDQDGRPIPGSGNVTITILDDIEDVLYHSEFDVAVSQFVDYEFRLTGQAIGKAYELRVPKTDIKKGVASLWGTAVLTFLTTDGKHLTAENNTVDIPTYSEEELIELAEEDYRKSAQPLILQAEDENFLVNLTKIGFYTPYTFFDTRGLALRADIEVLAKKSEYFWSSDTHVIDSDGVQHEVSYNSTFEFGDLQQGAIKRGYLLFDDVPDTGEIVMITINEYVFDLVGDRAYTYKQRAEENYEDSAAILNQTLTKGKFEVIVERAGFFTDYEKGGVTRFRVDMKHKNVGAEPEYFFTSMFLLDELGNQYESTYGGTLDTFGEVYPGVTKGGYVLFEDVPDTAGLLNLVFELGHDANYNPYQFKYQIDLK